MNEWLQNLISGYYNYNKPDTSNGKPKAHYTDNIDKEDRIEQLKKWARGYNNYVPPKTFGGKRLPHYTDELPPDNTRKALFGYYNFTPPKNLLTGEVMPHYRRAILKDATQNLPENFLSPEQRMRYYLSQDLENLGKRVGPIEKGFGGLVGEKSLLSMIKNLF